MKQHYAIVTTLLLLLFCFCLASAQEDVKDFTLPSATDNSLIRLSDYSGKVILINWWRSSCGFSQRETPKLVELYDRYRDSGLVILGISDDNTNTVSEVPGYLEQYGVTWPVGLNDQGEFMREIRPKGRGETPGNYLVTRDGRVTYLGLDRTPEDWQKLEATVVHALDDSESQASVIRPSELATAPTFSLPGLDGHTVSLEDFAGKPLVVNFFTSSTCDQAGAVLSRLHQDYSSRGLQVIGINLYDEDSAVQDCINRYNVQYTILRGDNASQMAWIGSNSAWATFFVTPDGKMFKRIVNAIANGMEEIVFRKYVEYLLAM